jgi:hypothetical protein
MWYSVGRSYTLGSMELLDENAIVDAVAGFLAGHGYEIEQQLHGHQKGVDIIACRHVPRRLIYVEAKGGTSSRVGSANHGKPMGSGEVRINIAEALYTAVIVATRDDVDGEQQLVSAVAFHDDERHRKHAEPLRPALDRLNIGVFWVTSDHVVVLEGPWPL